jgi:hypothetical protein
MVTYLILFLTLSASAFYGLSREKTEVDTDE